MVNGRVSDLRKKEEEEEKKRRREERREREGLKTGIPQPIPSLPRQEGIIQARQTETEEQKRLGIVNPRVDVTGTVEEQRQRASVVDVAAREEERLEIIEEQTGSGALKEELEEKVLVKPSLEPEPISDTISELALTPSAKAAELISGEIEKITGKKLETATAEELANTKMGKALGLAIAGTAGVLAGAVAYPLAVGGAAKTTVGGAMAAKIGSLSGTIKTVAGLAAGGAVLNWNSLEMNTQRKIISGFVEDGERLVAIDRASGDHAFVLNLLEQASAEVDEAERVLKEAGNNNILNRISKEYLDDMNNIRTARLAILRRVNEVNVIASTGQSALDPERLLLEAEKF